MNKRKLSRALVAFALAITNVGGYIFRSWRLRASPMAKKVPVSSGPPAFDATKIQRAPRIHLDEHTIDAFLSWVAATPRSNVQDVRDAIAAARTDDKVVNALIAMLFNLPARDVVEHLLLLSIIGEMCRPESIDPLVKFIGLPTDSIVADVANHHSCSCGACISHFDGEEMLKARAVEMLAWLRTSEALEAVLGFARYHESRVVRLAALDAYTYNHEDSPEAIERARAAARRDEAKLVGLPRFTCESNPAQFTERVAAFYEQHPEERPPAPHVAHRPIQRLPEPRPSR